MSREYSSAAKAAKQPENLPPGELPGLDAPAEAVLGWVAGDRTRARKALWVERTRPQPRPGLIDALELILPHFLLDGIRWVCAVDDVTILDITELARMHNVSAESPEGIAALGEFFETCLGPLAYRGFRAHCRANRTHEDTLMDIMQGLLEDLTDRPTAPPSPSPDGPSTTGQTSRVVSLADRTVRPMTSEEFARWQQTQRELGERTEQLLQQAQAGPPKPPGFTYFG